MMTDIDVYKRQDEVQFVLVFKLSRFGRNAADVLNSLQRMQDFGVNLICVEDGIDSSKAVSYTHLCIDFLVRMIDKYGEEVLRELEEAKQNKEEKEAAVS